MTNEGAFKAWLEQGGAQTEAGRNSRAYAVRTIERNLGALGLPHQDLDEAWKADRFQALRERLKRMREDAKGGGDDFRLLMPESEKPQNRLSNWGSWLEQYGRFLAGEPPGAAKDADRIRQYVLERYIEPAREEGRGQVDVLVRDVNTALSLNEAWPNICQALAGAKFREMTQLPPPERIGADQSPATVFRFDLLGRQVESAETTKSPEGPMPHSPVNLILYGPPGTGKTYATAAEAVRLCGEPVPTVRKDLMASYRKLLEAGRIAFVTFHQSMSYEEFIEGLRPAPPASEGGEPDTDNPHAGGFHLRVEDGIFKRISERARLDPGEGSEDRRLDRTRPIFKVALGRRLQEEAQIKAALDADEIRLGWGGWIDWSDERFVDWGEMKSELEKQTGKAVSSHAGDLVCSFSFRADMQVGDYVVVSDGRDRMRAFGTIKGDYFFETEPDRHPHRRKVNWLWRNDEGADRASFYPNGFRQHTVYKLDGSLIDWDGLERAVLGADRLVPEESARPHVLIIDEINRANISKVFGELITLLEADKRLGGEHEIQITLAYSKRPFGVPANLHVIGTMNTADRSIALLDTALRRRFTFREIMPDTSVLKDATGKCGIDLPHLLALINERIEYLYDREHQVGHAYFTTCETRADVDEVMRHKVIPLLAEYFFEDWAKIAAVLGDLEPHDGPISGGFLKRSVLKAPPGFEDGDAIPRFRWQVRSEDEGFDYVKLTGT